MFDLGFFLGGSILFLLIFLFLESPFVCLTKKKKKTNRKKNPNPNNPEKNKHKKTPPKHLLSII